MNKLIQLRNARTTGRHWGEANNEREFATFSCDHPNQAGAHIRQISSHASKYVTIVIPVHDALDLTRTCVNSIYTNTPCGTYQIIIVDNGSTHGVRGLLDTRNTSESIRVIRNRENLGFAKACNQGIRSARGHFVLLLNNDTVVTAGWLDALLVEMEQNKKVGIAGSCLLYPGSTRIQHVGVSVGWHNGVLFPYHVHRLRKVEHVPDALRSRKLKAVTGACMLVRREILDVVPGFDEIYLNGYEDIDFCFQALKAGFDIHYCGKSQVYHHESMSKGRHDRDGENLWRLNKKWNGIVEPDEDEMTTHAALREIAAREELQRNPDSYKCISMLQGISLERGDYDEARECRMGRLPAVPVVTIVIPTYNNLALTTQCLKSIRDTTSGIPFEIICVDNASSDGTVEFLKREESLNKLVLVSNGQNLGFAKACNQGAKLALGKYLVFLNNDIIALDGWLREMLKCMDGDASVGMVGSKLLYPQGTVQHAGVAFGEDGIPFHIYRFADPEAAYVNRTRELSAVTGACFLVRREVFSKLGGFDEKYENGLEDIDFCLRIREQALRILYCPTSVLYHMESVSEGRFNKTLDNCRYFSAKWGRGLNADDERICAEDGTDIRRIRHLEASMRQGMGYSRKTVIDYRIDSTPLCEQPTASRDLTTPNPSSNKASLLSIVILSLNQSEWTRACLESIRKHSTLPYEIILVDNGSSSRTISALLDFTVNDPRISVILNARNKGFAGGNNQGMALAQGDYILLLNNDTLVTAEWLEGLVKVFADYPKVGIVGPMSNHVAGPQLVESARYGNITEMEAFASRWRKDNCGTTFSVPAVIGFCMLVRRRVIDAIGGLDELFGVGNFEDIDYCYRAFLADHEIRVARDVFIHHQGSLTFKAENVDYVRLMKKNWELFKAKWGLDPGLALARGQRTVVLNKERALRQTIALPDLRETHEYDAEMKLWRGRSTKAYPLNKTGRKAGLPVERESRGGIATTAESLSASAFQPPVTANNPMPRISIIIPTYQNVDLTRQCLHGILHNKADIPCEIIVVDNHSTDGTELYLREMQSKGILRALFNPMNAGFARACNQGAQVAQCPFLLFLNNDTFPMKGWMQSLLQIALRDENAAIIGSKLLYPDGKVQHAGMELIHYDKGRKLARPVPGHPHRFADSNAAEVNQYREPDMVTGACILVRKEVFFLLGGFDEVYRNGVEDVDLCLRARCAGYKVVYQPESVVFHYEGQSPGRFDKEPVCKNLSIYFARWGNQFGTDGRLLIPQPPRIIRSQTSLLVGDHGGPSMAPGPSSGSNGEGLRICLSRFSK